MSFCLFINIEHLVGIKQPTNGPLRGKELKQLNALSNAWLLLENDSIHSFGSMTEGLPKVNPDFTIDCTHQTLLPAYCDSHTHLVYAATREDEFVDRINGLSYQEIAARGGGILNSAKKIATASKEDLLLSAQHRLHEIIQWGTGAVEIKSGYGLDVENEIKMLEVIQVLKETSPIAIKSTLLAAHAVPLAFKEKKKDYIKIIINEMIPEAGKRKLADFCDVFCEENYFTPDETFDILEAAKAYGMVPKVHANQLAKSGGVQTGVKLNAISVDHLEYVFEEELEALKNSSTIATILPGAQFFLQLPYPPAREMLNNNIALAIASDYNPGSSPSGNMNFNLSLACVNYKLTPEEAINAATINGAYAMNLAATHGSIDVGKKANLILTKKHTGYRFIPYSFANNTIDKLFINGKFYA